MRKISAQKACLRILLRAKYALLEQRCTQVCDLHRDRLGSARIGATRRSLRVDCGSYARVDAHSSSSAEFLLSSVVADALSAAAMP